jgi:uncharacterized protein DUF4345
MRAAAERRLLQLVIAFACLIPIAAGASGMLHGARMIHGVHPPVPIDLDSHFRYLSGLLLGIGIAFAACVPAIERRGPLFRTLGAIVVTGGFGRLIGVVGHGAPGAGHVFGLAMELGATPLLLLWQMRVERRFR